MSEGSASNTFKLSLEEEKKRTTTEEDEEEDSLCS